MAGKQTDLVFCARKLNHFGCLCTHIYPFWCFSHGKTTTLVCLPCSPMGENPFWFRNLYAPGGWGRGQSYQKSPALNWLRPPACHTARRDVQRTRTARGTASVEPVVATEPRVPPPLLSITFDLGRPYWNFRANLDSAKNRGVNI